MLKLMGWLGMALSIISYFITVNGMAAVGIPIAAIGCIIYGYYAAKIKIWNLFILQVVFFIANLTGIYHIYF